MKVLIGVDPHKASVAVAAVDEATGELVEYASFSQNRVGLRALERWANRFGERRWAVENAGGLGWYLAQRLAAAGESVVDVPSKLSARVRVLSTGNARKNDELDALATALAAWRNERLAVVDPEAASEVLRLLSERREDLVAERTRAFNRLHGLLRDLVPGGVPGILSVPRAARILRGIRPKGSSGRIRRRLASEILRDIRTLERKIADLNERIEAEVEALGTALTEIFGVGSILAAKIIGTVGGVARFPPKAHFASCLPPTFALLCSTHTTQASSGVTYFSKTSKLVISPSLSCEAKRSNLSATCSKPWSREPKGLRRVASPRREKIIFWGSGFPLRNSFAASLICSRASSRSSTAAIPTSPPPLTDAPFPKDAFVTCS
jgi:transposase